MDTFCNCNSCLLMTDSICHSMLVQSLRKSDLKKIIVQNLGQNGPGLSWFNWWVSFAPDFQCCCHRVCFILDLILISVFLR